MNRYPLDRKSVETAIADLTRNDDAQRMLVHKLRGFLGKAIEFGACENADWYPEAYKLLAEMHDRQSYFDTLRFDQSNGHRLDEITGGGIGPVSLGNEIDESNEEVTVEELAKYFDQVPPTPKPKSKQQPMTLEEIEAWERKQDNSNDIYKVKARVKNHARDAMKANVSSVGEMLVNTYVHVLISLYEFADKIQDKETKIKLLELIRKNETMPANFMAATQAKVTENT